MTLRDQLLEASLHAPVRHAEDSSKKRLRARVLELAASINGSAPGDERLRRNCERLSRVIEDIHQGSLIVDDIQDGSLVRRGKPALHQAFGLPLALNAGNYLYFRALRGSLEMELSAERKILLHKLLVGAMCEAHEGQAIDLGTRASEVRREEMPAVSREAARSKTGALLRAAFGAGYLLQERFNGREFEGLLRFGEEWGIGLQQLDDIGHYLSSCEGLLPEGKAFEDFRLGRPTWVWGMAALGLEPLAYEQLRALSSTPDSARLRALLVDSGLARKEAAAVLARLQMSTRRLEKSFGPSAAAAFTELRAMNEQLHHAYLVAPGNPAPNNPAPARPAPLPTSLPMEAV